MKRVLVTRPEPGASATRNRLRELGYDPIVLPLSRIVALPVSEAFPRCDVVAVTSANALKRAPKALIRHFASVPCYAVGAKTAAAAREAGFDSVRETNGNARELAGAIAKACDGTGSVAYLAGRVRLPDFEEALQDSGLKVVAIEVYDTEPVGPGAEEIELLRTGRPIDAVMIYSAKAAEAVSRLAKLSDMEETFSQAVHCCISQRVADCLKGVEPGRVRVADRPEEAAIFALLRD